MATFSAGKIYSVALVALLACTGLAQAETDSKPAANADQQRIDALVGQLNDDSYDKREQATIELMKIGRNALPALKKAQASDDPETAWRAAEAARMIRWGVSPQMWSTLGEVVRDYEQADPTIRERIVRVLRTVGNEQAIPVLREVLRKDASEPVRQVAAVMLADLGSKGLEVLVEEGVQIAGLDPWDAGVHVLIGNSFLGDNKFDKAEEHYLKALKLEPGNYIALYNMACVCSLRNQVDLAIEWLQKAVDAGYDEFEWMEKDTDLDNIRQDERYKEILRNKPKPRKRSDDGDD